MHVSVSLWVSHCLNVCIGALSQGGWVCMCQYLWVSHCLNVCIGALSQGGWVGVHVSVSLGEPLSQALSEGMSLPVE